MVFCFIIAFFATFVYFNIIISDSINMKVNPGIAASKDENTAVTIAKIKYFLLLVMAVFWSIIVNYYLKR